MKRLLNSFGLWMVTSAVMLAVVVVVQAQSRPPKIDNRPDPVVATYLDDHGQTWSFGGPDVIIVEFPEPVHAVHVDVDEVGGFMVCELLNGYRFALSPMVSGNLGYVLDDAIIRLVELHGGGFSNLTTTIAGDG